MLSVLPTAYQVWLILIKAVLNPMLQSWLIILDRKMRNLVLLTVLAIIDSKANAMREAKDFYFLNTLFIYNVSSENCYENLCQRIMFDSKALTDLCKDQFEEKEECTFSEKSLKMHISKVAEPPSKNAVILFTTQLVCKITLPDRVINKYEHFGGGYKKFIGQYTMPGGEYSSTKNYTYAIPNNPSDNKFIKFNCEGFNL